MPAIFYKNEHTKLLRGFCLTKSKRFAEASEVLAETDCFEQDPLIAILLLHCLLNLGKTNESRMLMNIVPRNKTKDARLLLKAFSKVASVWPTLIFKDSGSKIDTLLSLLQLESQENYLLKLIRMSEGS